MSDEIKVEAGKKRVFSTGAKRQAASGKGMPSLVPGDAILDVAKHFENGAKVYDARNWEKGLTLSSIIDSLERHIQQEKMGETDEPHARAILWNAMVYLATKLRIDKGILPPELDDMPSYEVAAGLLEANKPLEGVTQDQVNEIAEMTLTMMPKLELPDDNHVRTAAEEEVHQANLALPITHPDRDFFCGSVNCFKRGKPNSPDIGVYDYYCPEHTPIKEKGPDYV